jgi:hypothetical protein
VLYELGVPPRLGAHLRVVHAAACEITEQLEKRFPELEFDRDAVLFGAAVHDVGKTLYPAELSERGKAHEQAGYLLLLSCGVEERYARFAYTHAAWDGPGIGAEDLLVALADKVWRARRMLELEALLVVRLAAVSGRERWEVFGMLDEILDAIALEADDRMAFQSRHPVK